MSRLKLKDTINDRWKSICTYEYEILDKIRESSISDDEEPGDWAGYSLLRFVSVGAAWGIAQLITSASGHQLKRLHRSIDVNRRANREEPRRFEIFAFPDELRERGGSEYKTYRN